MITSIPTGIFSDLTSLSFMSVRATLFAIGCVSHALFHTQGLSRET
jgi:hypothetical protein